MKATELRIGNLIQDTRHPERNCTVFRLTNGNDFNITHQYDKSKELSYTNENCDALKPISLTEEWLVKFEWEIMKGENYYFLDNNYFSINPNGQLYYMNDYTAVDIKYVHQLQNLYFALTGEELTPNPQ